MSVSERQMLHFERIHDAYEAHYYDATSWRYREEFIYPLIANSGDWSHARIAELACGSGYNSLALRERFPGARFTGFDISPSACAAYGRNLGAPAIQADLTRPMQLPETFDMAFIVGGLHHCVTDLEQTLRNIAELVAPAGTFIMLEPNSLFLLEHLRKLWYRMDKSFDFESEHALNHDDLLKLANQHFVCSDVQYFGGPAYFGILNSMILRIPLKAKPILAPPLIAMERCWNRIPDRRFHNVFCARWRRTATAV